MDPWILCSHGMDKLNMGIEYICINGVQMINGNEWKQDLSEVKVQFDPMTTSLYIGPGPRMSLNGDQWK